MGGLEFVAALAGTLAWPLAVVACAVILRHQLRGLLHRLETVEIAGSKATFGSLARVEETVAAVANQTHPSPDQPPSPRDKNAEWSQLLARADSAPKDAVIDSWSQLEYQLNVVSDRLDPSLQHGWPQVGRNLEALGQWPALRPAVAELRHLRDTTAHSAKGPSRADASRYVSVARDLATTLDMIMSTDLQQTARRQQPEVDSALHDGSAPAKKARHE